LVDIDYNFNVKISESMMNWNTISCNNEHLRIYSGTPLSYSCALSNLEIIEFLINHKADINYCMGIAFRTACNIANVEIINYLLQFNLGQDVLTSGLVTACVNKNMDIMDFIIDRGYNIGLNSDLICEFLTPKGTPEMIQYLINHGLVLNSNMPLKCACKQKNIPLVKFYLEYGLKVDKNLLGLALEIFDMSIIKLFLEYHVDFSQLDNSVNEYTEVLCALEQNGLNIKLFANYIIYKMHKS
jgi:ankyrin repeat protein